MLRKHITFFDKGEKTYNPFHEENSNHRRLMALLLVQTELVKEILTDRQTEVVDCVILKRFKLKDTAALLKIDESTVSRTLKNAISKLRRYMSFLRHGN